MSGPRDELVSRLKRVRDLSADLARDLSRDSPDSPAITRAIVDAIKRDVDAIHRSLTKR